MFVWTAERIEEVPDLRGSNEKNISIRKELWDMILLCLMPSRNPDPNISAKKLVTYRQIHHEKHNSAKQKKYNKV